MTTTIPNTTFEYTVDSDGSFPNKRVDVLRLTEEIRTSSISVALRSITIASGNCVVEFASNSNVPPGLTTAEILVLDALVLAHSGDPLVPVSTPVKLVSPTNPQDHIPLFAPAPREGSEVIYATHNLCDKTTWYSQSTRVTAETLTDSGDGLTWGSANANWIDLYSGRVMDDDGIRADISHGYAIIVSVDGVEKTMREPYETSGGDFSINFVTGAVTFFTSQAGKAVVATYSFESGATWILRPSAGTVLDVESAEAQFSSDVVANDTLRFSIHGLAAVFAPEAVAGGQLQATDLVEIGSERYKRITQIVDQAIGAFPAIPAMGGAQRGVQTSIHGFPFRYGTLRRLYSSYGMELRVTLEHGRPFGGEYATATFYCVSRAEAGLL